jgi:hypothetical protein
MDTEEIDVARDHVGTTGRVPCLGADAGRSVASVEAARPAIRRVKLTASASVVPRDPEGWFVGQVPGEYRGLVRIAATNSRAWLPEPQQLRVRLRVAPFRQATSQ